MRGVGSPGSPTPERRSLPLADLPPETGPPILPPQDGFLLLDRSKFHQAFAADVDDELAEFMADSLVPWGLEAAGGTVSEPAWRSKPSWYLVTNDNRMIPPSLQREMSQRAGATVTETPGSHAIYVWQPGVVADLVERAASEGPHRRWPRSRATHRPAANELRTAGRCFDGALRGLGLLAVPDPGRGR
jgi:pimeloyl-ACP methyl ester carboxylesterase